MGRASIKEYSMKPENLSVKLNKANSYNGKKPILKRKPQLVIRSKLCSMKRSSIIHGDINDKKNFEKINSRRFSTPFEITISKHNNGKCDVCVNTFLEEKIPHTRYKDILFRKMIEGNKLRYNTASFRKPPENIEGILRPKLEIYGVGKMQE